MPRSDAIRWTVRVVGLVLILAGAFAVWRFVDEIQTQSHATAVQTKGWQDLIAAAAGPPPTPGASPSAQPVSASGECAGCYLKLTIPKLGRSMVAIDGDWTGLTRAPMVHYHASPAPGQDGNVLVAFHREFSWPDIDRVTAGDTVVLQTRDGRTWTYVVDFRRIVPPSDISLLQPISGKGLTLITCDPWLRDYNRMVFRLHLQA